MITAALFVLAAAAGAVARGLVATTMGRTAAVNVAGSFLLGVASGWTSPTLTIIGVGALGSLTTFSTFIAHVVTAAQEPDERTNSLVYLAVSVIGGVLAALVGIELAG